MSLTKNDLKQIEKMFVKERIYTEAMMNKWADKIIAYVKSELKPIKERLTNVEKRLDMIDADLISLNKKVDQLIETEDEDVKAAYGDIENVKMRLKRVEHKLGLV